MPLGRVHTTGDVPVQVQPVPVKVAAVAEMPALVVFVVLLLARSYPYDGTGMLFIPVPEGKTAKNRVHLDVRAAPGLEGDERMLDLVGQGRPMAPGLALVGATVHSELGGRRLDQGQGASRQTTRPSSAFSSTPAHGGPSFQSREVGVGRTRLRVKLRVGRDLDVKVAPGLGADDVSHRIAQLTKISVCHLVKGDRLRPEDHQHVAVHHRHGIGAGASDGGLGKQHGALFRYARERDLRTDDAGTGLHFKKLPHLSDRGKLMLVALWPVIERSRHKFMITLKLR